MTERDLHTDIFTKTPLIPLTVYTILYEFKRGTAVAQWLRCYATNRKVAGSIPDGVIALFH